MFKLRNTANAVATLTGPLRCCPPFNRGPAHFSVSAYVGAGGPLLFLGFVGSAHALRDRGQQ
jgi:hypothetical protein